MRYRPKVVAAMLEGNGDLGMADDVAWSLIEALDRNGYDVIEKRRRRRERDHLAAECNARHYADKDAAHVRQWGEEGWRESRIAWDRVSFLYEQAIRAGASPESLTQPDLRT